MATPFEHIDASERRPVVRAGRSMDRYRVVQADDPSGSTCTPRFRHAEDMRFRVFGPGGRPSETDPPLAVDTDAVGVRAVAFELLESVPGRDSEVDESVGGVENGNVTTPQTRVEGACARLGRCEVVGRCTALLAGASTDPDFIITLGGPAAIRYLNDGQPVNQAHWLRVWAARGLLWAGPGDDISALRAALADDHWRVREMVCKIAARHRVGELLDDAAQLEETDPVKRVRIASARAVMRILDAQA